VKNIFNRENTVSVSFAEHETFKIRDENPWVTVEPNGSVRVKKRWDYEELGREKTIDFWVIITNSGAAGRKSRSFFSFFFNLINYNDNSWPILSCSPGTNPTTAAFTSMYNASIVCM
jgi:hypothetical protein